jgi:large subunit ribosomal protein L14
MVQLMSKIQAADNSGARLLEIIRIYNGHRSRYATVGDIVACTIRHADPHAQVKKGEVVKVVIVRTKKEIRRKSGIYIRFDNNAGVIIDPKTKEPRASRIFGPVARELRNKGFMKIISLAPEVL